MEAATPQMPPPPNHPPPAHPAGDGSGKCTCCPYGYHIDLDFLNFCRDVETGSTLRNLKRIQRAKRKLRKSMEVSGGDITPLWGRCCGL